METKEKQEAIALLLFVADRVKEVPCNASIIADALIYIMDQRIIAIKAQARARGEFVWSCGTHSSSVRKRLREVIGCRYNQEQLDQFGAFSLVYGDGGITLADAEEEIATMLKDFIQMRPKAIVHH